MASENEWVTVASTYFLPEADVMRSALEEQGIPVFLKGEHTSVLGPPLSLLDRGVRIQVPRFEQARAEEILRGEEAAHDDFDPGGEPISVEEGGDPHKPVTAVRGRLAWTVVTGLGLLWIMYWLVARQGCYSIHSE
jgi:hypothetical protein